MNNGNMNGIVGSRDRLAAVRNWRPGRAIGVIWAEKTAFALLLVEAGSVAALWLIAFLAAGRVGANHVFASIGAWRVEQGFLAILALWISFRVMDFIAGGPTYRLFFRS